MFSTCAFLISFVLATEQRLMDKNHRLEAANKVLLQTLRQISQETGVGDWRQECYNSCRQTGSYAECNEDCYGKETGVGDWRQECYNSCRQTGSFTECNEDCYGKEMNVGGVLQADRCAKRTSCVAACIASDETKRFECVKEVCPKDMCAEEMNVGGVLQADRCAKRTSCVAACIAGDENKRFECVKEVCPKDMCSEEKELGDDFYSQPTKDCWSFNSSCENCRGAYASCCSDKNCSGGRKCKAGIWSYSCV